MGEEALVVVLSMAGMVLGGVVGAQPGHVYLRCRRRGREDGGRAIAICQ